MLKFHQHKLNSHNSHSHDPLNTKTIAYNATALKAIRDNCKHVEHAKILPFGAIRKLENLELIATQSKHNKRTDR